jgi:hypothetical protein
LTAYGPLRSEGSGVSSKKLEYDMDQWEEDPAFADPFNDMSQRGSENNDSDPQHYPQAIGGSPVSVHHSQESDPLAAAHIPLPPSASPSDQPPIPERHPARSDIITTINPEITVPPGYPQPLWVNTATMTSPFQLPPQQLSTPQNEPTAVAVQPTPAPQPQPAPAASSYVPTGRQVDRLRRELTHCMSNLQKVILGLAMFLMVSTVVTMISVFRTAGRGHAAVSKRILLCGVLIIVASSAAAMFAIQRNFGEVLLTMTMVLVLGIFLSSFQDIIYDS